MQNQALPAGNAQAGRAATHSFIESWLAVTTVLLLMTGGFFLLWPTAESLIAEWEDTDKTTYTHGYLIAAICLWLVFRERRSLRNSPIAPSVKAAIGLFIASIAWLVAVRAGIQTLHQLLLPVLLWLAVFAALGLRAARISAFAIGYMLFAIPIWSEFNGLLQNLTTKAVDLMLATTGVNAYVEGNIVHLASGTFEVAGGCSGLHYVIVSLALAALYGEINSDTRRMRLQLLAMAGALAILANWLRVYIIIVAGYLTDMQHYLVRVEHYRFGWVVFAVMMGVFFMVARRFPLSPQPPADAQAARDPRSLGRFSLGAALSVIPLAIGPLWNAFMPVRAAELPPGSLFPASIAGSSHRAAGAGEWQPSFVAADRIEQGEYGGFGSPVQFYSAVYASQAQEKELVGYRNSVVGDETARVVSTSRIESNGRFVEQVVENQRGNAVLWYFYQVGSVRTDSGARAQFWYGMASLLGNPASRVIALRAPCTVDCESARTALRSFAAAIDGTYPVSQHP